MNKETVGSVEQVELLCLSLHQAECDGYILPPCVDKAWEQVTCMQQEEKSPTNLHRIQLIRSCLDDGSYTAQEQKDIGWLCDVATAAVKVSGL